MIAMNENDFRTALDCAENDQTNLISIGANLLSLTTFNIQNTNNLVITNLSNLTSEERTITVRTQRIFRIVSSTIHFSSLFFIGSSLGGGISLSNSNLTFSNCHISPENHLLSSTLSGGGFQVTNSSHLILLNSTISNWKVSYGGAIYLTSSSSLTLISSSLHQNEVSSSGGGIFVTSNCSVEISSQTEIINNLATRYGGGVFSEGNNSFQFSHVNFINNSAGEDGGGIYSMNQEDQILNQLFLENILFQNNYAGSYSGGLYLSGTIASMKNISCLNNFAGVAGGCLGIFHQGFVEATNLIAFQNILGDGIPASIGGAVFISTGGEFSCADSTFSQNYAGGGGVIGNLGGDVKISHSSFFSNVAENGGVLYSQNTLTGQSSFVDCLFQDNSGEQNGGVFFVDRSILTVNNSLLLRNILNSATDNRGGILASSNSTCLFSQVNITDSHAAVGGAFLCTDNSYFHMMNSSVKNVYATNNGGVIRTEYNSQLWLTDVSFVDCNTEGNGGIMNIQASTFVTMTDCSFRNSFSGGIGGSIYLTTNSQISLIDCHFETSEARDSGGCIAANGAIVSLTSGTFSKCRSTSGGAIYLQSSILRSVETIFEENYGDQGGAILGDADTEITLDMVQLFNNSARYKGGTILLTGGLLVATKTLFNSSFSQYGGAIHASVGTRVLLLSSKVTYNTATYEGGAVVLQSGDNSYFNGTIFEKNHANTGAAMYLTNSQADISDCSFISNEAFEAGGVLALFQMSTVSIKESIFKQNRAYRGGVFYLDYSAVQVDTSSFVANFADSIVVASLDPIIPFDTNTLANGYGAVFYAFLSKVQLTHSVFNFNFGYVGGVGWAMLTYIASQRNNYQSNQAYNGGVYAISEHNILNSTNDNFSNNKADLEGSIFFGVDFGILYFSSSEFHGHYNLTTYTASMALTSGYLAMSRCWINGTGYFFLSHVDLRMSASRVSNIYTITGGAIQILSQSTSIISTTSFISNIGEIAGGAITYKNTNENTLTDCHFENNIATAGGAIEALAASLNISQTVFISNKAQEAGGGIFWTDSILHMANNTFINNTATFGPDYATSPKALLITNPQDFIQKQSSGSEMSADVRIVAIDYYHQQIHLSQYLDQIYRSAIIVAQTVDRYSSISGVTIQSLDVIKGYTIFSNLTVTLTPASNVTLEFSFQGSSSVDSALLTISFRECQSGEIQTAISTTQAICSQCPEGYYSFDPDDPTCSPCPDHAYCPGGDVVDVQKGYWRQCQDCHEIKQCKSTRACQGGTDVTTQCHEGYHGPLCDVCSDGYFRSGSDTCVSCGQGTSYIEIIFAVLLLLAIIFIFMFWKKREWLQERFESLAEKFDEALEKYELKAYLTKLKILIGFLQILVNIPEVLAVVFPSSFSYLLNSMNLINLNFFKVFATQCYVRENFYTDLLLATIFPPCLAFIFDCILRVKYQIAIRLNETQPFYSHKQKNIDRRIIFLIIAFCVFSPVSITIFQTFVCEKFENGESYLVADYSVRCWTTLHDRYVIYAVLMVFLYPIGIPVYYIYHLARKREYINPLTSLVVRSNEKNIVSALVIQEKKIELRSEYETIKDISFLYDSYLPKCWYFEIIECFRRIALTALPVLFLRSTVIQVVLVLLVSLGFSALYMELRPFVKHTDNAVAIVSQWTLSLTFLGALCMKVDMSEDNFNTNLYLGVILTLINAFTLVLTCYLVIMSSDEENAQGNTPTSPEKQPKARRDGSAISQNIKLQDLKYEYDSDDDSEVTPEGVKKFQSVELENTKPKSLTATAEIRSLKEYQRRASIKQQILQNEENQSMGDETKDSSFVAHENVIKNQRRLSTTITGGENQRRLSATAGEARPAPTRNKSIKFEQNLAGRPSEAEDFQIYRYSRSNSDRSRGNDNAPTTNPLVTPLHQHRIDSTVDSDDEV
jgi:predicted outer membrane repeat protein